MSLTGDLTFPIYINGQDIESVNEFLYLGNARLAVTDIKLSATPIISSVRTFLALIGIWKCRYLNTNIKLRLFHANIVLMLLYEAST